MTIDGINENHSKLINSNQRLLSNFGINLKLIAHKCSFLVESVPLLFTKKTKIAQRLVSNVSGLLTEMGKYLSTSVPIPILPKIFNDIIASEACHGRQMKFANFS